MGAIALVAAVFCSANHAVVDADALSRLSLGRYLWEHGLPPAHDPFTFARADTAWSDPEWLGDLGLYALFAHSSEQTLQLAVIAIACLGYVLAFGLALSWGASAALVTPLLLSTLATTAPRISARNDVHLLWLVPAFAWLATRATRSRHAWIALLSVAWLWSQVHSSFVLSIVITCAALFQAEVPQRKRLAIVLLALPLLPFLGPIGASSYAQLYDHVSGGAVYRAFLSEWASPVRSSGWLAILPLHVIALLGLMSCVLVREQRRALPLTLFVMGVVLAYSSRRFLPMLACAAVPGMAASLTQLGRRVSKPAQATLLALASVAALCHVLTFIRSAEHQSIESVFARSSGPEAAVRFLAHSAPQASRVFNDFDDGPWLLWFGRPDIKHYIDPRNDQGAAVLDRYVHPILTQPSAFEAEVQRLSINLVLIAKAAPFTQTLWRHLSTSQAWGLIYWDGWYAVYARDVPKDRVLLEEDRYRVLRPTLDLRYLRASSLLERDLSELDQQSQPLAAVIRAYRVLREPVHELASSRAAADTIARAWPTLPGTDELSRALSEVTVDRGGME